MEAVDQITDAYGRHTITLGKSWIQNGWQMKRDFLSPCVTTDILVVPGVR
jgi:DNA polymerase V